MCNISYLIFYIKFDIVAETERRRRSYNEGQCDSEYKD